jgi:hypothetical protein
VNESFAFHTLTTIVLMNFHHSFIAKQDSFGKDFNKVGQQVLGVSIWIKTSLLLENLSSAKIWSNWTFECI